MLTKVSTSVLEKEKILLHLVLSVWAVAKKKKKKKKKKKGKNHIPYNHIPVGSVHIPSNFLKVVFHKFHLVHSWILCPKYIEITIKNVHKIVFLILAKVKACNSNLYPSFGFAKLNFFHGIIQFHLLFWWQREYNFQSLSTEVLGVATSL